MGKKGKAAANGPLGCCRMDAIVSIDARGQVVLPKDVRDRAGIKAGDKFAVVSMESGGKTCCIALVMADNLSGPIRDMLGPMMK